MNIVKSTSNGWFGKNLTSNPATDRIRIQWRKDRLEPRTKAKPAHEHETDRKHNAQLENTPQTVGYALTISIPTMAPNPGLQEGQIHSAQPWSQTMHGRAGLIKVLSGFLTTIASGVILCNFAWNGDLAMQYPFIRGSNISHATSHDETILLVPCATFIKCNGCHMLVRKQQGCRASCSQKELYWFKGSMLVMVATRGTPFHASGIATRLAPMWRTTLLGTAFYMHIAVLTATGLS